MGGERLFTGEPDPGSTDNIAPENRSLGQIFQCSEAGRFIIGGGIWVQAGVCPELWQVWLKGTATQLASHALAPLNPSGTGWRYFTLAELGASDIGPLTAATDYVVNSWTPSGVGQYVFSVPTSYPFGTSPLSSSGCIFRNNGTSAQIPNDETFGGGRFYADITLDSFSFVRQSIHVPRSAPIVRAGSW